jgi:cyclase
VGDPINAVKIFNEKEVDELCVIDIDATREKRGPHLDFIREIVSEAFMPIAYGGGVTRIEEVRELLYSGVEKVIVNKMALTDPSFIRTCSDEIGAQSIVVSLDVKKTLFGGYKVFSDNGRTDTGKSVVEQAKYMEQMGAGEILLNNIDRDGTYKGYDAQLIRDVSAAVSIPVVAVGGASSLEDFHQALEAGASAVAAGSLFVFQRPHRAVLISYPDQDSLKTNVFSRL